MRAITAEPIGTRRGGNPVRCRVLGTLAVMTTLLAIAADARPAFAQTFHSGSTGADGAFNPTTNTTLQLPPDGVFHFTTINVPSGVSVTFARNTTNTPVTMLASGNVVIAGTINLNGSAGGNASTGTSIFPNGGSGGPGGFGGGDGADGIVSTTGGPGLGPGGGAGGIVYKDATTGSDAGSGGGGGSFGSAGTPSLRRPEVTAGPTYGVNTLVPLIGGSGGGGGAAFFGRTGGGGGGGGGAIVIASSGTITFTGSITAMGGNSSIAMSGIHTAGAGAGGSGGAVRLVANTITGSGGSINVAGGSGTPGSQSALTGAGAGGSGRIRIEASTNTATINFAQAPSIGQPGVVALPSAPTLTITSVAGVPAPTSPSGAFANPDIILPSGTASPVTVGLAASNIPLGTTVTVTAKPLNGGASSAVSSGLAGSLAASTASASVSIPTNQPSVISASATFTLAALPGTGPLFAQGEPVDRMRVSAVLGGASRITYVTTSGREVALSDLETNESGPPLRSGEPPH
jgi:hypothetical protein